MEEKDIEIINFSADFKIYIVELEEEFRKSDLSTEEIDSLFACPRNQLRSIQSFDLEVHCLNGSAVGKMVGLVSSSFCLIDLTGEDRKFSLLIEFPPKNIFFCCHFFSPLYYLTDLKVDDEVMKETLTFSCEKFFLKRS